MPNLFDAYEATSKTGEPLTFHKLHDLGDQERHQIAALLAEEWAERTATGQVTFRATFFHFSVISAKFTFFGNIRLKNP